MNRARALPGYFILLSLLILLFLPAVSPGAEERLLLERNGVIVQYTKPHRVAAGQIIEIFPTIRAELENTFGWALDRAPTVVLSEDHESFQSRVSDNLVVAYAVPTQNLVVLDSSMMKKSPFSLGANLKHELSHLFLHSGIPGDRLPKWLDEGVAQWVSGVAEILTGEPDTSLDRAALSGNLIPIRNLENAFPSDDPSFQLAYEESKSLVEFLVNEAGSDGLRRILDEMRKGAAIDAAVSGELGYPIGELERNWQRSLSGRMTWVAYTSRHLYSVLFFLAGLATVFGFIRFLIRKRAYKDEDGEESE